MNRRTPRTGPFPRFDTSILRTRPGSLEKLESRILFTVPTTSGIAPVTVDEDTPSTTIDLATSFADVEDIDADLVFSVVGTSNTNLFDFVTIEDSGLTLTYAPNAFGTSDLTIRATDTNDDFVETTLSVTVNPLPDPGRLGFATATFTVGEDGATATIVVLRDGGSDGAVSANYAVTGGTAQSGTDFTLASGIVSFANGEGTKTFNVTINEDQLDEAAETVIMELSDPGGNAGLDTFATATLTITDNDGPPALSIAPASFVEGDSGQFTPSTGGFVVTLSEVSGQSLSVDYLSSYGDATSSDLSTAAGTLTFTAGETSKLIHVSTFGDIADEVNETFTMTLSNPVEATIDVAIATGTILDDDNINPLATSFTAVHGVGQAITIDAFAHVVDSDGDPMTLTITGAPTNGTAVVQGFGTETLTDDRIVYTPNVNAFDTDSISYQVDDGRGGVASGTITLQTFGASLLVNPTNAKLMDLVVVGTTGDDDIKIYAGRKKGEIKVMINEITQGNFRVTGKVLGYGLAGNDAVSLKYVSNGAIFYGGDGNDRLEGSRGADVLIGGEGNDRLSGFEKRDLMIGGEGSDTIVGGFSDDILIGGSTSYDADLVANRDALSTIVSAWDGKGKTAKRMARIAAGVGDSGARLGVSTVFPDNVVDSLGGNSGKNWIFGDNEGGVSSDLL